MEISQVICSIMLKKRLDQFPLEDFLLAFCCMKWDLTSSVKPEGIHHEVKRAREMLLDQRKLFSGMETMGGGENTD